MESVPRIAYKTAITLLLVLLISLVLTACSGSQQIDRVAEVDSATTEPVTTANVAAETPTAIPSPTVTSTATIPPSPTPSPTPFPGPNDAEYNMLRCIGVGGVQGFVNFDESEVGLLNELEAVVEPAFYEGSNDLLHNVWSHFYQQKDGAPLAEDGGFLPYGVFQDTLYDVCLLPGVGGPEVENISLIIPQIQSVDTIKAACMSPNANGFAGQTASQIMTFSTLNAGEEGILASEALAGVELSDCYGFISGAQTPWENAVAHLIDGQYAKPVFNDLNDSIPDDAILKPQTYQVFTRDKDVWSNRPFRFELDPTGGNAVLVECIDNNFDQGMETYYPQVCSTTRAWESAPYVEADHVASYTHPANIDLACISDVPSLGSCQLPFDVFNVFPGVVIDIQIEQVRVQYRASNGTFTVGYGHIVPNPDLSIGDKVDVGDVLGTTYQRPDPNVSALRHYLALTLVDDQNRQCLDILDPQHGLFDVIRIANGKVWTP